MPKVSKDIKVISILLLAALILALACNPVKQVLRDPVKTQTVVDRYNAKLTAIDTAKPTIKPGVADTNEVVTYDTSKAGSWINGPFTGMHEPLPPLTGIDATDVQFNVTEYIHDTIRITKTVTKTITRVDTLNRPDPVLISRLQSAQRLAASESTAKDQYKTDAEDKGKQARNWKIYFWLLVLAVVSYTVIKAYLKFK